ncbi:MAG TPA: alpha/beta hydrolase [Polyangiaceae bacterium]|nr:alpha/beta hydrolase [Polyangiaceae bacterium]
MHRVQSRDGTELACETSGSGPALVIVNGALSDRSSVTPLRAHLDRHFTVVGYDRRGRGDSGDTAPYRPERELEDLAAVVLALEQPAFVFGHSSGAILALRAALNGVPMQRLALNEPPFILPGTRPMPPADITARVAERIAADDREGALRVFFGEQVGLPAPAFEQMKATPLWPRMVALAHTTPYDSALAGDSALPPAALLGKLSLPVLVLNGTASTPWLAETARALVAALPNARGKALEGQAHSPAPDVLAPVLVDFFQEARRNEV